MEETPKETAEIRPGDRPSLRVDAILFLLVVVAHGYFHGGGLANQNARFDAIVAFVDPGHPESGTFRIDRFIFGLSGEGSDLRIVRGPGGLPPEPDDRPCVNTCDWSFYPPPPAGRVTPGKGGVEGHYYANKAPGTLILGAAVYFYLFHGERLLGIDPRGEAFEGNLYLVNLVVSVMIGALGIVAFRRVLMHSGVGALRALVLALVLAFGTLLFPYHTQLWGHPTAAAFGVIGLGGLLTGTLRGYLIAGFFAGMAVMTDYLAVVFVAAYGVFILCSRPRLAYAYVLGGIPPLVVFLLYHQACFGSPFALATKYTADIFRDEELLLGLLGPASPGKVLALLVSRYRGILVHMPVLILAVAGMVAGFRRTRRDGLLWLSLSIIALVLLVNASFNGWAGGFSVAARYQIIALPFWVLFLKELPRRGVWTASLAVLAVLSVFNMTAVAAVSPLSPECPFERLSTPPRFAQPIWTPPAAPPAGWRLPWSPRDLYDTIYGWSYRQFMNGGLAARELNPGNRFTILMNGLWAWRPTNAGLLMGLRGTASLAPLGGAAAFFGFLLLLSVRRERRPLTGTPALPGPPEGRNDA